LTTQYLEEADRLADTISVIDSGRVIQTGTPSQLKARVGGQTLTVRPVEPACVPDTAEIVMRVAGTGPASDTQDDLVSVALPAGSDAAATLAEVAGELRRAGIAVGEIGVRLASLDEVFLTLTAREMLP